MQVRIASRGKANQKNVLCKRTATELPYFGLVHLCGGSGFFWSEASGQNNVSVGDTIILIPGIAHSYGPKPGQHWNEYWILVNEDCIDINMLQTDKPVLRNSFHEIWSSIYKLDAGTKSPHCDAMAVALCGLSIVSATSHKNDRELGPAEIIMDMMSKELQEAVFDFDSAARSQGYSPVHMRRLFKDATGRSPVSYFNYLKIEEAKRQLTYTSKTVHAIAQDLGWKDDAYFRRVFTKTEGMSPSHWKTGKLY